jgi:hypothetical protein
VREVEEEAKDEHRSAPTALKIVLVCFLGRFLNLKILSDLKVLLIDLQVIHHVFDTIVNISFFLLSDYSLKRRT